MSLWSRFKAAVSSVPYFQAAGQLMEGYGSKGQKPRPFNADAAIKQFNHWAYAAAILNANAVANVPLRLYGRVRAGRKCCYETRPVSRETKRALRGLGEWSNSKGVAQKVATFAGDLEEIVEPHPALGVLQTVNPWDNGYNLTVLRMIDLQATGNSYLYVVDSGAGVPGELWRMPSQWTSIKPSKTNFIDGYVYGKPPDDELFSPDEVIQFKLPNPDNLHYGKGWFEAAWTAISLHDSKRRMDLSKFDNMARPDWLLSVKTPVTKDKLDAFEDSVNKKLRGSDKAGKFLTINGDIAAQALNLDVPEVGTPTRVIEEISAVSGVPVAMLLSNDPTKSSSMTARVGWYRNTIRPYCRLDEEKLNEKYLPMFRGSEDLVLAYDLVSFEDDEAQAKRLVGLVAGCILKPNEARTEMGYDRSDDPAADKLYPPSGTTGGAAAVAGDVSPGQNDERQN
jgi:phage portal protein BeeE